MSLDTTLSRLIRIEPLLTGDEESEWRKSQLIDQDEEVTDADDDIISGCYVLNISIPHIPVSHLWIRADYIRVFNYFQHQEIDPEMVKSYILLK